MMRRIFLAINIPEHLKEEMLQVRNRLPEVPCKWTSKENLHFTLVFLGNTSDKELEEVLLLAKGVGERHGPFLIKLSNIVYGPSKSQPKMIWAVGSTPKELLSLQKDLENAFSASTILHFTQENPSTTLRAGRPYSLHLTLGRLNELELQTVEQDELPIVDEEVSWKIPANSFEVMESHLKRGGAEYTVVESFQLSPNSK